MGGWKGTALGTVLALAVAACGGGEGSATVSAAVGELVSTGQFEIRINDVRQVPTVGGLFGSSSAADGGTYVAVRWSYRNISREPVSVLKRPTLQLRDASGVVYSPDAGASVAYAAQVGVDAKVLSDLNPGIGVTDVEVFEIAGDSFDPASWRLVVVADQQVEVALAGAAKHGDSNTAGASASPTVGGEAVATQSLDDQQAAVSVPAAAPGPPETRAQALASPSFDCTKASSFAERTICGSAELARLDVALAKDYRAMLAADIGDGARRDLRATQRAWIAERDRCTSEDCLVARYRERLDAVCDYPVLSGVHWGCSSPDELE